MAETSPPPATHAKILFTRRGLITSCATRSTRSRGSNPIRASRNSFAGCTSSRKARSSGRSGIDPEPANRTGDSRQLSSAAFPVPIAQDKERECPKLQVAGESPAGDTISSGCGSTAEYGFAKAETTVRLRSPAPFSRGRSSSAERSFDMREAKRAALFVPTISEGIAQPARADASHASGQRCKSFCPHHPFVPVV